jgi:DNA-binding Lrp family transcriptional regulator
MVEAAARTVDLPDNRGLLPWILHRLRLVSLDHPPAGDLERMIVHELQVDGRVPFARVAERLGTSPQTVQRRYTGLLAERVLRVVGVVDPVAPGYVEWLVRVECRPGQAQPLARALSARSEVTWVNLASGGAELICTVRAPDEEHRDELLLERLPRSSQLTGFTAHSFLHRFAEETPGWSGYLDGVRAPELPPAWQPAPPMAEDRSLDPVDRALIDLLQRNGRAAYRDLARRLGTTAEQVSDRMARLRADGVLRIAVELDPVPFGFPAIAYLWLSVVPRHLDGVGRALAVQPEVLFSAALSGPANVVAAVATRSTRDLYRYLTTRVSGLPGVQHLEVVPVLRRVKLYG